MKHKSVLDELAKQELIFHRPKPSLTCTDFEDMIDNAFWEVGASGRCYTRKDVINALIEHPKNLPEIIETKDFHCLAIAENHYLLTYTAIEKTRATKRSSIWRFINGTWKILYHQGTLINT